MVTYDAPEPKLAVPTGRVRNRRAFVPGRDRRLSPPTRPITLGFPLSRHFHLAKPNYSFEKRQREIAKKKEKDEKDARKREAREAAKQASGSGEAAADDDSGSSTAA